MYRFFGYLIVIFTLALGLQAQNQLATPSTISFSQNGIMFDVQASQDLRLTGIEVYLNAGLQTVEIYRKTGGGSLAGSETNAAAWTLLDSVVVYSGGPTSPTLLPTSFELNLDNGAIQGLYVTTTGVSTFRYSSGSNFGGVDISDGKLAILEGVGKGYPFAATLGTAIPGSTSRLFRGVLHYALGTVGTEQSTSTLISPNDSEESMTFDVEAKNEDIIVSGLSVHLSGGVSNLELWVTEAIQPSAAAGTNFANFRKIGELENFFAPGGGQKVRLPMDFEVVVPAGQRRGFYLTTDGFASIQGRIETGNGVHAASHPDLKIYNGNSYVNHFGIPFGSHMIDATVHYRKPLQLGGIVPGTMSTLAAPSVGFFGTSIYFDLSSTQDVVVEGLDCFVDSGPHTIEVWARNGGESFLNGMTNQAEWTRISVETTNLGAAGYTTIASNLRLFIPAGGVQGLYLAEAGNVPALGMSIDNLAPPVVAADSTMSISLGNRSGYPFVGNGTFLEVTTAKVKYRPLGRAENGFYENFSTASGIAAPAGWISSFVDGNREKLDGWRFDNPGGQTLGGELAVPVAICDSDDSGTANPIDAALISPSFDASVGKITLNFSNRFEQYLTSTGDVDVWDGSTWTNVAQYTVDTTVYEESLDITAACGGSTAAKIRFRYVGNYDWYWIIDNVHVQIGQAGQRPQLGIGEFDINYSKDAAYGQPVSSGLPGPYVATANIFQPTIFSWDGEPNQPLQLFTGFLNLANVVLVPQGQLDVGSYDPITNTFPGILLLADGTGNDLLNAAFRTSNGGRCTIPFFLPPYAVGQTFHFQSVVYSSTQNIALTNVVSLTVDP